MDGTAAKPMVYIVCPCNVGNSLLSPRCLFFFIPIYFLPYSGGFINTYAIFTSSCTELLWNLWLRCRIPNPSTATLSMAVHNIPPTNPAPTYVTMTSHIYSGLIHCVSSSLLLGCAAGYMGRRDEDGVSFRKIDVCQSWRGAWAREGV